MFRDVLDETNRNVLNEKLSLGTFLIHQSEKSPIHGRSGAFLGFSLEPVPLLEEIHVADNRDNGRFKRTSCETLNDPANEKQMVIVCASPIIVPMIPIILENRKTGRFPYVRLIAHTNGPVSPTTRSW